MASSRPLSGHPDVKRPAGEAAFLGPESHEMALHRGLDGRGEERGIVAADGLDEVSGQAEVAAAVAALDLGRLRGVPDGPCPGREFRDGERGLVAHGVALRAHDAGAAAGVGGQGLHGEGGRDPALEFERRDLVVDDVVVAVEDAAAVGTFAQGLEHGRVVLALEAEGREPGPDAHVDLQGGERAGGLDRASVGAAGGRAGRGVLGPEVGQRAEGRDAAAGPADRPAQDVEIVAGLGEDHGIGLARVAPVAADEGVGHVDVLDGLHVLDARDAAEAARVDDLLELAEVGRVAEDVADGDDAAPRDGAVEDGPALVPALGDDFFEEEVVVEAEASHGRAVMQVVRCRDDQGVGELGDLEGVFPGHPLALGRDAVEIAEVRAAVGDGLGDADDLELIGELAGVGGIDVAAVAGAEDDGRDGARGLGVGRELRGEREPGEGRGSGRGNGGGDGRGGGRGDGRGSGRRGGRGGRRGSGGGG